MADVLFVLLFVTAYASFALANNGTSSAYDNLSCSEKTEARNRQRKPTLNNIGYLGSGYDIIFANPHSTESKAGIDPGYRQHIFDLTKYCGDVTADLRYQIPENVTVRKQVSGKLHFNVHAINSTRSFTKTLGSSYQIAFGSTNSFTENSTVNSGWVGKIIGEGVISAVGNVASYLNPTVAAVASGIGKLLGNFGTISSEAEHGSSGLAFSASRDFKHVTEEITKRYSRFVETVATCTVYKASINAYAAPALSRNFRQAVATLPSLDYDEIDVRDERYAAFFNEYGTHVITAVLMGASYGERYSMDENSWSKIEGRNVDWKLGASRTTRESICRAQTKNSDSSSFSECMGIGGNQGSGITKQNGEVDGAIFSRMLSDRSVFTVGSLPPGNMEVESWIQQSFDNPVPVHLTLDLIVNMLTKQHFPDDPLIAKRRASLLKALASYCETILKPAGHVSNCEPVEDPPVPDDDFQCRKVSPSAINRIAETVTRRTGLPQSEFAILPASFNNKFYLIAKEQVSRVRGNEPCRRTTKGATKLAIMERESEFTCVSTALSILNGPQIGNQRHFWVGMTRENGNTFLWENGAPFTYTLKWARNEPNNATKWFRYRGQTVRGEDNVILMDDRSLGIADGFRFNDVSEISDWPSPLCEGKLHRFEIPPNSLWQESMEINQPVRFGDAVVLRNQRYWLGLEGPITSLMATYASLTDDNDRRHCHLFGAWILEERGWYFEKWKKVAPISGEIHFGDIVQISNHHGNPVLDSSGSYSMGEMHDGWRSTTDDLWRIHPCFPSGNSKKTMEQQTVHFGDCAHLENVYYPGCYLYAYQQMITSTHYLSCSNQPNKKQLWVIESQRVP